MYDAQRWWEDIMLFYIFDIELKLSHREEAMNLQSLIIKPPKPQIQKNTFHKQRPNRILIVQ